MYIVEIEVKVLSNKGNEYTVTFDEEIEARDEIIESYYGHHLVEANESDLERGIEEKYQNIINDDSYLLLAEEQIDELDDDENIVSFADNL